MGGPALLLDTYSGAAAAYSLRRLATGHNKALQIRRELDNTEVDVYFDARGDVSMDSLVANVTEETTGSNTSLTTAAANLGEFVFASGYTNVDSLARGSSALVQCWYDQSGNGADAIQVTAGSQPSIVSAGTLITDPDNGLPAIKVASTWLPVSLGAVGTGMYMSVVNEGASQHQTFIWDVPVMYSAHTKIRIYGGSNFIYSGAGLATDSLGLTTIKFDASTAVGRFNATEVLSGDAGTTFTVAALMGRAASGIETTDNAHFQEMVKWASWDVADTPAMEGLVNTFYSIY